MQSIRNTAGARAAQSVSSRFGGSNYYNDFEDRGIFFAGGRSDFSGEAQKQESFSMTISNNGTSAEDRVIAIFPGPHSSASEIKDQTGSAVSAILTDGDVINTEGKKVTATGSPNTIEVLKDYVDNSPLRFSMIKLKASNSDVFDNAIYIRKMNPFRGSQDDILLPANFKDSTQNDDTRAEIPLDHLQVDSQTVVFMTIPKDRSLTITWFPGATRNLASELDGAARKVYGK